MANSDAYLLDTNVLVHLIRGSEPGANIDAQFRLREALHRSMICVVTAGELYAFALRQNWGAAKQQKLQELLEELVIVDISHSDVLRAYAEVASASKQRPMQQNDMWIAAACRASKATLLTMDSDFDHLHPQVICRIWIDPMTGISKT